MKQQKNEGLNISVKSFLTAIAVIFVLMIASYILTMVIPGGVYARIPDENGNPVIDTAAGFTNLRAAFPSGNGSSPRFWCWVLPAAEP